MDEHPGKRGRYENTVLPSSSSSTAASSSVRTNLTQPTVSSSSSSATEKLPSQVPSSTTTPNSSSTVAFAIPPEYSYLSRLQLLRNDCCRWSTHLAFDKLVKNHFIRIPLQAPPPSLSSSSSTGPKPSSRLIYILSVERSPEEYDIEFPMDEYSVHLLSSSTNPHTRSTRIKCRYQLRCYDFIVQKYQLVKLNFISNSIATVPEIMEYVNLLQNLSSSSSTPYPVPLPDATTGTKTIELFHRMMQDNKEGKGCFVTPNLPFYTYLNEENSTDIENTTTTNPKSLSVSSVSHIWGTMGSSTSNKQIDQVIVLLRSWLAQDVLQEQYTYQTSIKEASRTVSTDNCSVSVTLSSTFPSTTPSSSSSITTSLSSAQTTSSMIVADTTWATAGENLQPCIAVGRDINADGIGHGPMGVTERTVGNYMYCFTHRQQKTSSSSSNTATDDCKQFLAPLTMTATVYDEGIPDITAWRAVRTYIDNDIPLTVFREAVVAEIHALPSVATSTNLSSLIDQINVASTGTLSSSSSPDSSTSSSSTSASTSSSLPVVYNTTGYPLRRIHSNQLIFIIDLDYIARARSYTLSMNNNSTASTYSVPFIENNHTIVPLLYDRYYLDRYARQYIHQIIGTASPVVRTTIPGHTFDTNYARIQSYLNRTITNPRIAEMVKVTQRQDSQASTQQYYHDGHMDPVRVPSMYTRSTGGCSSSTSHSPSVVSYSIFPHGLLFLSERQMLEQFIPSNDSSNILSPLANTPITLHLYEADTRVGLYRGADDTSLTSASSLRIHEDYQNFFSPYLGNLTVGYDGTKLDTLPDITNLSEGIVLAQEGLYRTENFREKFTQQEQQAHYSGYLPLWSIYEPFRTLTKYLKRSSTVSIVTPGNLTPEYGIITTTTAQSMKRSRYGEDEDNERKKPTIIPYHPHGPLWVPSIFPHRWGYHKAVGYHGTSVLMGEKILQIGFYRAQCRQREACKDGHCDCNMGGFGCYFGGDRNKADYYALRRAVYDSEKNVHTGATVISVIDLGYVHVAKQVPCACGCGTNYVDHWGSWYNRKGYDALYTRDHSVGAVLDREWAIADPLRVHVHSIVKIVQQGSK